MTFPAIDLHIEEWLDSLDGILNTFLGTTGPTTEWVLGVIVGMIILGLLGYLIIGDHSNA